MLDQEFKNFVTCLVRNKKYLFTSILFFSKLIFQKVEKKIVKRANANYSQRAKEVLAFKIVYPPEKLQQNFENVQLGFSFCYKTSIFEYEADHLFCWIDINNKIINDPEILESAHRWYWLLYDDKILKQSSVEKITDLAKHWIASFPYNETKVEWAPYNVSERISSFANSILLKISFSELKKLVKEDKLLLQFFHNSIHHLSSHLEYYPQGLTFNHVVNNLKGLLSAAVIIEDEKLIDTSSELLLKELEFLVQADGFIREGSSHYQLIMTRWMCELEWLCLLSNRIELKEIIKPFSRKMLHKSLFYFVWDEDEKAIKIPLIGDVSPDFDPFWMIDYFQPAYTIAKLSDSTKSYGDKVLNQLGYLNFQNNSLSKRIEKYDIITKIDFSGWTMFIRHQAPVPDYFPNHAHDDYSSYVLFYKGKEVVSDPGRIHYLFNKQSQQYISSGFHNCITVENLPLQINERERHLFPSFYKEVVSNVSIKEENKKLEISIYTDSLKRIATKKVKGYKRDFIITDNEISILDNLLGEGNLIVAESIVFHPLIGVNRNEKDNVFLRINNTSRIEVLQINDEWKEKSIMFSEKYRSEKKSVMLQNVGEVKLPIINKIEFKVSK